MATNPNVSVSLKVGESRAQIKSLKDDIKGLSSEFKIASEEIKYTGMASEKLTEKQKMLADTLERQQSITKVSSQQLQSLNNSLAASLEKVQKAKESLAQVKKTGNVEEIEKADEALSNSAKSYASLEKQIADWTKSVEKSKQAERELEAQLKNVDIELKEHDSWLQKVDGKMEVFAENYSKGAQSVQNVTSAMKNVGTGLTIGVTAPLTAAAAASFVAGQEINKNLANISTLGVTTERLGELKKGLQDIAIEVGKDTTDIADGVYRVIAAFDDSNDTLEKTKLNAKSAAAGLATTEDAMKLSIAVTKGYNDVSIEATQKASDLAFQTMKIGEVTYSELANSIGSVVPKANALKISQEELFNVFATLTGVTGNASEVATQYASILNSLMEPQKELTELLNKQGYASGFAAVEALGFMGTLDLMTKSVNGSNEELVKLVGRSEATTAMLALTGAQSGAYTKNLIEMQNALGATDAAFKAQTEGVNAAGFSFQQSMARMQVAAQDFADTMAPTINAAAEWIEGLTEWLSTLDDEGRNAILLMGAAVAAAGPLLSVAANAISVFHGIKTALIAMGGAAATAGASLGWITVIGMAVAGIVVAVGSFINAQKEARQEMLNTGEALRDLWSEYDSASQKVQSMDILISQWENLKSSIDSNKLSTNELAEAKEKLVALENQIATASDGTITNYDIENGLIDEQIPLLKEKLDIERDIAILRLQQKINDTDVTTLEKERDNSKNKIDDLREKAHEQQKIIQELQKYEIEYQRVMLDSSMSDEKRTEELEKLLIKVNEIGATTGVYISNLGALGDAIKSANDKSKDMSDQLDSAKTTYDSSSSALDEHNKSLMRLSELEAAATTAINNSTDAVGGAIEPITEKTMDIKELSDTTSTLITETENLTKAFEEQAENGKLSSKTIMSLIEAGYAHALQVDAETGVIRLNEQAYKDLVGAKLQDQIITLELARENALQRKLESEREAVKLMTTGYFDLAKAKFADALASGDSMGAIEKQIALINNLEKSVSSMSIEGIEFNNNKGERDNAAREAERIAKEAERAAEEAAKKAEAERKAQLTAWESYWKEREEISNKWIDNGKYYNDLNYGEEIAAYDRVLAYLRQYKEEAAGLEYALAEEKAEIAKELAGKIESYERKRYEAEKKLQEESIDDTGYDASKRENELKRNIDQAESLAEKYKAYSALREEIESDTTRKIEEIYKKFWLTKKEQQREEEIVAEEHANRMLDIDKNMYNIRKEMLTDYADEWYKVQKKTMEDNHADKKKSLEKELESVREHYAKLDAEERNRDRNKELGELYQEASLYQGAATKEGQDKYKSILDQIEALQKEEQRDLRQADQKSREDVINDKIQSLDEAYKIDTEKLDQQYEAMKESASKMAKSTALNMESAALQVTDGLTNIFGTFNSELGRFNADVISKVGNMVSGIQAKLNGISLNLGSSLTAGNVSNSSVVDNRKSLSVSFTDSGNKYFSSGTDMQKSWLEANSLILASASSHL